MGVPNPNPWRLVETGGDGANRCKNMCPKIRRPSRRPDVLEALRNRPVDTPPNALTDA